MDEVRWFSLSSSYFDLDLDLDGDSDGDLDLDLYLPRDLDGLEL